jgi:hypothetical protein
MLSAERALAGAESLADDESASLTAAVLRVHADRMLTAARDQRMAERFSGAHPVVPLVEVAAQATDVHDLSGLRAIGAELASGREASAPLAG